MISPINYTILPLLEDIGEDIGDYESIWGYSIGETEGRSILYDYPEYEFKLMDEYTNLRVILKD